MPKHKVWINKRYLKTKKLLLNRTLSPVSSPRRFTKPWGRGWRYPLPLGSLVECYKSNKNDIFLPRNLFFLIYVLQNKRYKNTEKELYFFPRFYFFIFFSFWSLHLSFFGLSFYRNRSPTERCTCSGRKPLLLTWHPLILLPFSKRYVFRFQLWSVLSKVYY